MSIFIRCPYTPEDEEVMCAHAVAPTCPSCPGGHLQITDENLMSVVPGDNLHSSRLRKEWVRQGMPGLQRHQQAMAQLRVIEKRRQRKLAKEPMTYDEYIKVLL